MVVVVCEIYSWWMVCWGFIKWDLRYVVYLLILMVVLDFLFEVLFFLVDLFCMFMWLLFFGVGWIMVFIGCVGSVFGDVGGEFVIIVKWDWGCGVLISSRF